MAAEVGRRRRCRVKLTGTQRHASIAVPVGSERGSGPRLVLEGGRGPPTPLLEPALAVLEGPAGDDVRDAVLGLSKAMNAARLDVGCHEIADSYVSRDIAYT
jgi:hypothetical protein